MGFDVQRLSPTYRLQVGQPGRSYALAIARRMGMPEAVMERATEVLGPEGGLLERLLEGLEHERSDLQRELERARLAHQEAETDREQARYERQDLETCRQELMAEAAQKAEAAYAQAIEQVKALRARAHEETARPRVMRELSELRSKAQQDRARAQPELPRGDPLKLGSNVTVPAYGASGQVLEMRGDELVVQLGLMKVNVRRRDVRLKQEPQPGAKGKFLPKGGARGSFVGRVPSNYQSGLQLRGKHVEEALEELRGAIAEAAALRETPLRVVHGKGQGVLRRLIRDYLKTDKRVESFRDAEANQGGHGVTIVNLKV